ncbi:hypothetical protein AAC387_Pa07g1067 [Persea americana]
MASITCQDLCHRSLTQVQMRKRQTEVETRKRDERDATLVRIKSSTGRLCWLHDGSDGAERRRRREGRRRRSCETVPGRRTGRRRKRMVNRFGASSSFCDSLDLGLLLVSAILSPHFHFPPLVI